MFLRLSELAEGINGQVLKFASSHVLGACLWSKRVEGTVLVLSESADTRGRCISPQDTFEAVIASGIHADSSLAHALLSALLASRSVEQL